MSRELHDERISAYLDGELSPREREEMEDLFRTSSGHQQLLTELTAIRESLQGLPTYTLGDGFAARVTSAAQLAARQREAMAEVGPQKLNHKAAPHAAEVSPAAQARRVFVRKWLLVAAGGIATIVACAALVMYSMSGRPVDNIAKVEADGKGPVVEVPAASEFVRAVASSRDNEAVVVRIKLTKDAIRGKFLDNALAAHGIQMATPDVNNEAARKTGLAYKEMVKSQTAATPPRGAADVVFLEADVEKLEKALQELKVNPATKAAFAPESVVASIGSGAMSLNQGESEPGGVGVATKIPTGGYFQHMPPRGFSLAPSASPPAPKAGTSIPAKKSARVLIVVEVVE